MSDELLPYYNEELAFIRRLGAEFAEAHPKIAGRLRLGADAADDPHVARLIESFAFLNARIRHRLDDDFPEISHALLSVLYPHYLAPIPSMSIVEFALDPGQGELTAGYTIPRGAALETEPIRGEPCRFQTCYPVTLWPIRLEAATLSGRPFEAPRPRVAADAAAVIRLRLRCLSKDVRFEQFRAGSFRFFLQGLPQHIYPLYELLFTAAQEVVVARSPRDEAALHLGRDSLRPVGFNQDEGMLPYPPRSFLGYRLLTEFFAFAEKFLFFDLTLPSASSLGQMSNAIEIYIYLERTAPELEQHVSSDTFRLGCAPIVNLFRQRAEPIALSHATHEYRVAPDARRAQAMEVYSIDRVSASSGAGEALEFAPFYGLEHAPSERARAFWHASRRAADVGGAGRDHGTEVFLSLVDLDFKPSAPANWFLTVDTTCLNRDLPQRLPFGGGQPRLELSAGGAPVGSIACLTAPTPTRRAALGHGALWRVVSHLALAHVSIVDGPHGAEALREILRLYDYANSPETRSIIDGLVDIRQRRVVGRVGGRTGGGICRGVEVTALFDEDRFSGSGLYLFASVLERFLGLYSSVNSFSQFVATIKGRHGALRTWPPRAGDKVLL